MFADDAAAILMHLGAGDAIVCGHSMGGSVAQVMALHTTIVSRLICASGRAFYPHTKGIPLRIAKEMVEWGYEKYVRDHGITVGFTESFFSGHPGEVARYLDVRMAHLNPVEFFLNESSHGPRNLAVNPAIPRR